MKLLRVFSEKLKSEIKNCLLKLFHNLPKYNISSNLTVIGEALDDLLATYDNILFRGDVILELEEPNMQNFF